MDSVMLCTKDAAGKKQPFFTGTLREAAEKIVRINMIESLAGNPFCGGDIMIILPREIMEEEIQEMMRILEEHSSLHPSTVLKVTLTG